MGLHLRRTPLGSISQGFETIVKRRKVFGGGGSEGLRCCGLLGGRIGLVRVLWGFGVALRCGLHDRKLIDGNAEVRGEAGADRVRKFRVVEQLAFGFVRVVEGDAAEAGDGLSPVGFQMGRLPIVSREVQRFRCEQAGYEPGAADALVRD